MSAKRDLLRIPGQNSSQSRSLKLKRIFMQVNASYSSNISSHHIAQYFEDLKLMVLGVATPTHSPVGIY